VSKNIVFAAAIKTSLPDPTSASGRAILLAREYTDTSGVLRKAGVYVSDGTQWSAQPQTLSALSDVDPSNPPVAGSVLYFNGTKWVAADLGTSIENSFNNNPNSSMDGGTF
jgi:hypothetical protein